MDIKRFFYSLIIVIILCAGFLEPALRVIDYIVFPDGTTMSSATDFVGVAGKAADSELLDGLDSLYFAVGADLTTETSNRITADNQITVDTTTLRTDLNAEIAATNTDFNNVATDTTTLRADLNTEISATNTDFSNVATDTTTLKTEIDLKQNELSTLSSLLTISTNVYVVGYSSATTYYGDGSNLTGIAVAGDNLGDHTATENLNMSGFQIIDISSITITGANVILTATSTYSLDSNLLDNIDSTSFVRDTGDTMTGDYNFESGTLFVDSVNNKVGFGTTNPTNKITIEFGALEFTGTAAFEGTGEGLYHSGGDALGFATAGTVRAVISNEGIITFTNQSRARAHLAGGTHQIIPNTTYTKVILDTENYDEQGEFNTTAYRFTAAKTGYYQVNAAVLYQVFTIDVSHEIILYKNGSTYTNSIIQNPGVLGYTCGLSISDIIPLDAGDYIELYVYHAGSNGTKIYSTFCFMSVHKLS